MDDINFDFDSTDLPKKPEMPKWKRNLLIGGIITIFVILLIIIIVLIVQQKNEKEEDKNDKKDKKDDDSKNTVIGQFRCKYNIENIQTATPILGKNFTEEKNLIIIIESQKVEFLTEYKFDKL